MFGLKLFRLGVGGTWPGHIVLKLNKNFLHKIQKKLLHGTIIISGTNGKTTTSLLTTSILQKAGYLVLHNASGANLLNGIASSFIQASSWSGKLKSDIAVIEVDEANLPGLLESFSPNIIMLLNLSRDQLDRYGEIEIMLEKWNNALHKLPNKTKLVLNHDDKRLQKLTKQFKGDIHYFSLDKQYNWPFPLLGDFNKLNTLAAVEAGKILGISNEIIIESLKEFRPAFGRGENFLYKNRKIKMLLAKNPASFNANLKMITQNLQSATALLFILNDNIPDGRDVSWIYDIEPELFLVATQNKKIFISGKRYLDFHLRLKYASLNMENIWSSPDIEKMTNTMVQQTKNNELLLILPTYSAMLQSRRLLCGRTIL